MIDVIWGWAVLACPVAFVAGFIWIGRANELEQPIDGIPTHVQWLLRSLGAVILVIVLGAFLFVSGLSHSGGSSPAVWPILILLFVGPFAYCIHTFKWTNRIRLALRAQRIRRSSG